MGFKKSWEGKQWGARVPRARAVCVCKSRERRKENVSPVRPGHRVSEHDSTCTYVGRSRLSWATLCLESAPDHVSLFSGHTQADASGHGPATSFRLPKRWTSCAFQCSHLPQQLLEGTCQPRIWTLRQTKCVLGEHLKILFQQFSNPLGGCLEAHGWKERFLHSLPGPGAKKLGNLRQLTFSGASVSLFVKIREGIRLGDIRDMRQSGCSIIIVKNYSVPFTLYCFITMIRRRMNHNRNPHLFRGSEARLRPALSSALIPFTNTNA